MQTNLQVIEAYKKVSKFLKYILDLVSDAVLVVNRAGTVVYYNERYSELFGSVKKGSTLYIDPLMYDTASTETLQSYISTVVKDTKDTTVFKILPFHLKNNQSRIRIRSDQFHDYTIFLLNDFADRTIDDVIRAHEDRMESISHINSQLSHELKTPLSTIKINSERLIKLLSKVRKKCVIGFEFDQTEVASIIQDALETLEDSLSQLSYIQDTLYELAMYTRLDRPKENVVHTFDVVTSTLTMLRRASSLKDLPENQIIIKIDDLKNIYVRMTKTHLSQILWNLCINACEAVQEDGKIYIIGKTSKRYVYLRVLNDGNVEETVLERMFDPSFSTKSAEKSPRGLGLAIVKNHVLRASGDVWASNYLDKTMISVKLPIYRLQNEDTTS